MCSSGSSGLVGRVDAGEMRQFAPPGLCVVALDVARLANINRCIDENFYELPAFHQGAGFCALRAERGDDGDDGDQASVHHQFGDFGDPADVFHPASRRKIEILAQSEADIVPVQKIRAGPEPRASSPAGSRPSTCRRTANLSARGREAVDSRHAPAWLCWFPSEVLSRSRKAHSSDISGPRFGFRQTNFVTMARLYGTPFPHTQ